MRPTTYYRSSRSRRFLEDQPIEPTPDKTPPAVKGGIVDGREHAAVKYLEAEQGGGMAGSLKSHCYGTQRTKLLTTKSLFSRPLMCPRVLTACEHSVTSEANCTM